ncbi:unnamed protein product [Caretta caretta]
MFSNPFDNNLNELEYGLEIFEGKKNFRENVLKLKYEEIRSSRVQKEHTLKIWAAGSFLCGLLASAEGPIQPSTAIDLQRMGDSGLTLEELRS